MNCHPTMETGNGRLAPVVMQRLISEYLILQNKLKNLILNLIYIKRWIKDFRPGYLTEIVKHDFARKRALEVYKKALSQNN